MRRTGPSEPSKGQDREPIPESASFETVRLGVRRSQAPIVVIGFVAMLGALVAVGVGGRTPPAGTSAPLAAAASTSELPAATPPATPGSRVQSARQPRASAIAPAPVLTSGAGPIRLQAQRSAATMFVHGDVFVPRVTWVYVSLVDAAGNVAGWASVSVPGAAGAGQGSGPTLRFDVELAIPAEFSGPLRIGANAYDDTGVRIASARIDTESTLRPRMLFEP